ncbi:MAG: hypothetical protein MUD17_08815 [Gemmatimonadaceae bacterium]|jgi:hypothetical protein|nr:hypothetical protein [Gemmatimonadaceae bacterium]
MQSAVGVIAQVGGATLVMFAGNLREPWMVVTGAMVGAAGLLLWGKAARLRGRIDAEQEQEALARSAMRTDQLVLELQQQVSVLRGEQHALWQASLQAAGDARSVAEPSTRHRLDAGAEPRPRTGTTPLPPQ